MEAIQNETQWEKGLRKNGQSISELKDFKQPSRQGVAVPEGKRKAEKIFEQIMAKNFPNLMKTINPHLQEA